MTNSTWRKALSRRFPLESMVLVFKTTLQTKQDCRQLAQWLDRQPAIERWSVDLDDCDKVLRVVTTVVPAATIETLVQSAGFACCELPD